MSTESRTLSPLKHPFALLAVGPSGAGKSHWVVSILKQADKVIDRPPKRIIWCYGQWQPLYEHLKCNFPNMEFVKGIPYDLENDSYFDSQVDNLIVLDDLMGEAKMILEWPIYFVGEVTIGSSQ